MKNQSRGFPAFQCRFHNRFYSSSSLLSSSSSVKRLKISSYALLTGQKSQQSGSQCPLLISCLQYLLNSLLNTCISSLLIIEIVNSPPSHPSPTVLSSIETTQSSLPNSTVSFVPPNNSCPSTSIKPCGFHLIDCATPTTFSVPCSSY